MDIMAALSYKCQEFNDLFKLYVVILRKKMYQYGTDATSYFFLLFYPALGISFKTSLFT